MIIIKKLIIITGSQWWIGTIPDAFNEVSYVPQSICLTYLKA